MELDEAIERVMNRRLPPEVAIAGQVLLERVKQLQTEVRQLRLRLLGIANAVEFRKVEHPTRVLERIRAALGDVEYCRLEATEAAGANDG